MSGPAPPGRIPTPSSSTLASRYGAIEDQPNLGMGGAGMLAHVGQRFLDDAQQLHLAVWGETRREAAPAR